MREEFKRLGGIGDWEHPYLTMNYGYQATIVRALGSFVEQGAIYKGKKPVHWCIHCRTALAEAEVEYEDHSSPSIYVEFPLSPASEAELRARVPALPAGPVSVLIWTTTPWTIPSNLAIAFHPGFAYGVYPTEGGNVIVAKQLAEQVQKATGRRFGAAIALVEGWQFEGIQFRHPLYHRESVGVLADYVTLEQGRPRAVGRVERVGTSRGGAPTGSCTVRVRRARSPTIRVSAVRFSWNSRSCTGFTR